MPGTFALCLIAPKTGDFVVAHLDEPLDRTVMELITEQAGRTPDAVAVEDGERRLTYAELEALTNRVARRLSALGVGPEVVVGLRLERSLELVAALLAVLKAGGAYLPLDPEHPDERQLFALRDANARLLITSQGARRLPGAPKTLNIEALNSSAADLDPTPPIPGVRPLNLAYVIYTSGSTGRPKGVMATHIGLSNRLAAQRRFDGITSRDVCCMKTSPAFVDAVFETVAPLANGARLVVADSETGRDARRLWALVAARGVTRLTTTPVLGAALVLEARSHDGSRRLKSWTFSGEKLGPELPAAIGRALPGCRVFNIYGSSEVAADATAHAWRGSCDRSVPIGRPLSGVEVLVLDDGFLPVTEGEAFVGGTGVARGYIDDARLTAERFVPHPTGSGRRVYRTGDRVAKSSDGTLEFIGRRDRQVKVNGERIELDEIEAVLAGRLGADRAAVVLRPDEGPWAFVAGVSTDEAAALRDAVARQLPRSMQPKRIVVVAQLPLTASGKVDRVHLASCAVPLEPGAGRALRGADELALAKIWSEVLERPVTDAEADFFELGGDSLRAAAIAWRISEDLHRQLPLRLIFDYPRLADLARRLPDLPPPSCAEDEAVAGPAPRVTLEGWEVVTI